LFLFLFVVLLLFTLSQLAIMALSSRIYIQTRLPIWIVHHPAFSLTLSGDESNFFLVNVIECSTMARHIHEKSSHSALLGALLLICYVEFGSAQRIALLAKSQLFKLLVSKLMRFERKYDVWRLNYYMKIVVQRHHWRVSEYMRHVLFYKGRYFYAHGQFSLAIQFWGQAALLQDKVSHAILADMLIGGRPGVPKDPIKAFEFASKGERMGCPHSMGVLALCNLNGIGCSPNIEFGEALARYSVERGNSPFDWHVQGITFYSGLINQRDCAEAALCFQKAAAHEHAGSLNLLGVMHQKGLGVFRDYDKSRRCYEQAAKQGLDIAKKNLKNLIDWIWRQNDSGYRSDG
jgi:hypothetical protein